jgi:Cd2+/Zn2+-exporting ATPase
VLSGDKTETVSALARETGIHDFAGGLLPEEKLARLASFLAKGTGLAFVGDGINDAPVLSRADVGIAMGSGADVALEAADVIIMGGDPILVPEAISRARLIRRIVMQNIVFALGFKLAFLSLGAFGLATMWEALIADVGVALLAVLNSTRALSGRVPNSGPRPASRHIVQS